MEVLSRGLQVLHRLEKVGDVGAFRLVLFLVSAIFTTAALLAVVVRSISGDLVLDDEVQKVADRY